MMQHKGVRRCIPYVYFRGELPRWRWEGKQPADYQFGLGDEILYGLVMEYFEDCEQIDMAKVGLGTAERLAHTISLIHQAGVQHNDIDERNILLVREDGTVRIVWIDFSCAWTGKVYYDANCASDWDDFRAMLYEALVSPALRFPE